MKFGVKANSKAETFVAPFRVYLTLFETDFEVDGSTISESGGKIGGKVRGEVTSRVVFSKNGKSLTKSYVKGYVTVEGDQVCSVKMFKVKSHIWTKVASKDNSTSSESDEVSNYSEDALHGNIILFLLHHVFFNFRELTLRLPLMSALSPKEKFMRGRKLLRRTKFLPDQESRLMKKPR